MMTNTTNQTPDTNADAPSGMSVTRIATIATIVLVGLVLLLLGFALVISVTASETWAPVLQIFRDMFLIIFIVEFILVIGAIAILIVQVARFFVMLQTEIKPILDNARETTKTTKQTAQFVSKNAVDPLIQIKSFFAGLRVFIREIFLIRRLIKPKKK